MGRKTMRKYNKIMKRYKKTIKRKYKGGLTPRKSTLKKLAPTTKRKNSDEYYGFKLQPLYNQNVESSFGFSSSPRSAESYGFKTLFRKNTARICDRNNPNYYDCIAKKQEAPRKKSPTPSEIKRSNDRRSQEGHRQEFLRRRAEARIDPNFAAKELAIDDQRLAQLYGQKWNKEVAKQIAVKNKKNNKK